MAKVTIEDAWRDAGEPTPTGVGDFWKCDKEIAEKYPCHVCGSTMHYESHRTATSYRAFAVCDNPECNTIVEF